MHSDHLPDDIPCLALSQESGTLVSSAGFNCDVWRVSRLVSRNGEAEHVDIVIKRHREACAPVKARAYLREYRILKRRLDDIVPDAVFVVTRVGEQPGLAVLAQACEPWFDLANASNEAEAVPLLARLERARHQLALFVQQAREWERSSRLIDLYGSDNLVLDKRHQVRYLDSFNVFFYTDVLHSVADSDPWFEQRIEFSQRRLDYLEALLEAATNWRESHP